MTGILSQEAAGRIWTAHREIETGRKLLADIRNALKENSPPTPIEPGRRRDVFTFGRGSYDRWSHISEVSPRLAIAVIEAHIAEKERELKEASIAARIELESPPPEDK